MASEKLRRQTSDSRLDTSRADTQLDSQGGLPREADATAAPARRWVPRSAWMARLLPSGIKERLFLLIVLAMIPVLLLQGWIYYNHYTTRRDDALRTELEVAQGVARTFTSYLNDIRQQLSTAGQAIITFAPYTDAKAEYLLGTVVDQSPTIHNVSWVSPEGRVLASSQPDLVGFSLSHRPYFQEVVAGNSWSLGDLMPRGSVTQTPIFIIASAIDDSQGAFRGLIVAAIEPTHLGERTFEPERPAGGAYTIFDRQGQLVYRSPETPLTWEQRSRWRQSDPLLQRALDSHVAQGSLTSVISGDRRVGARVPIPGIDWVAGASRPMRIALGPVRLALLREAALGLLVTSFAFLLAYFIAGTIARPLLRLEQDAQTMGQGKIGPPSVPDGPKEVRRLRSTMTQMANDLVQRAESLRESEHRYRTLAENTPEVIARFDRQLRHTYINEYGATVYGVPRQNVIGKTNADLGMPADKVVFWNERFEQVFATGRQQTVEFEFDSPTFGHQYFSSLFVPEFDAYGRVASGLAITRDVTEAHLAQQALREANERLQEQAEELQVQAEELQTQTEELQVQTEELAAANAALRESQERLHQRAEEVETLMEVTPVAIWVSHDPQCNQIVGNRAANSFYEAYGQENVSANVSPIRRFFRNGKELKPDDLPMQKAAARNMDIRNTELDVLLPSGKGLNMLGSASPLRDADGRVRGCVGAFVDITQRKWTEEKLRQSEARLNRAQEIAHLGSWELDLITNKLTWSDEVYRIFGLKPQEFGATYEAFLERVHPEDRQGVHDAYTGSLREGRDTHEIEHRIIRKNTGEVRTVYEKCEHFRDVTGKIARSVGMVHDITERKQAEEALRSAALFPEKNPSPVLRVARDGTLLYANATSARLLEQWNCRLGRTIPDEIRRHVELALDSGEATEVEVECDQIVYSFSITPIPWEGYVNLYGRDITEHKRTEEAPRESCETGGDAGRQGIREFP